MKTTGYLAVGAALASSVAAASFEDRFLAKRHHDLVSHDALMAKINLKDLKDGLSKLQEFADKKDNHTRVFGGPGHKATVDYLVHELNKHGYYKVEAQEHKQLRTKGQQDLKVNGQHIPSIAFTFSPSANVSGNLIAASNLGCNATDYPPETDGKIVIVERGLCTFLEKQTAATNAKAKALILYNNAPGDLRASLQSPYPPGVAAVGVTRENGLKLLELAKPGKALANLFVHTEYLNLTTWNVLAETKEGDHNNVVVLGAHTDSVEAGPGINDDGSGTIALLNIAKALTKFKVKNAVRFGFWTAEEFGLLGSRYYVNNLPEKELAKIRLYLNFDMIGSPNYMLGIYDGDGNAFNKTGPPGSSEIEHLFEKYFDDLGWPHIPTEFSGRSDYEPFIKKNIPSGGLFTGAEGRKTAQQAKLFGGEAGVAYDVNYHLRGDTTENIHHGAFLLNARAAAYALAEYALSTSALPPKAKPPTARAFYDGDLLGMCLEAACEI
ncbi:Leucyl aminopeptidase yscIV [Ophidiomyces ophidiicola]|nr:Leucyl aminopeptidase yscIV [Ophidiomyces ophidiicola]KAI1959329.1 Leucyl aminopeptidase yscIV [Ophidiomyces ophidiicola]